MVDWYSFCRDVCRESLFRTNVQIGGPEKVVEIDESAFGKRKYNRGARRNTYWVFGGIERNSKNVFAVSVRRRNRATLWPIIFKYIAPGTHIISDGWKAYLGLDGINGYKHEHVNHSENFVDPVTAAHTNSCEGNWLHLKMSLPRFGTRKTMLQDYFSVFLWRRRFGSGDNGFLVFLKQIAEIYNPNQQRQFVYSRTQDQSEYPEDADEEEIEEEDV